MKEILRPIHDDHILNLVEHFEKKIYYSKTNLFYEEHIPHVAYVLLDGMIALGRKNKIIKYVEGKNLIGVKNLYQKVPVKFFASIMPNSTVLIIDRTTLFKVVNKKLNLYRFFL